MSPLIKIDYGQSKGSYAFDLKTQRLCLDMVNHYSSLPLGYNHPTFQQPGFQQEVNRIAGVKTSLGLYDSSEYQCFLKEFKGFACPPGFNHVHFACTGSLAVEAAVKTAWGYWQNKNNFFNKEIFSINKSFHGINSFGNFMSDTTRCFSDTTIATSDDSDTGRISGSPLAYRIDADTFDSVKKALDEGWVFNEVAMIIVEPIRCTIGDQPIDINQLKVMREICDKFKIPLIFDEIQTGFGTTGKTWYYEHLGVEPDIIIFGKKSQVSGIMVKDGFAGIFKHPEKLSVTFDGDLIDMIRCRYIMETIKKDHLMDSITLHGENIRAVLDMIPQLNDVRGIGGLIAFDMDTEHERDRFCEKAFENGLMVNPTGELSVRMRPNLAITTQEAFTCTEIIKKTIFELYL